MNAIYSRFLIAVFVVFSFISFSSAQELNPPVKFDKSFVPADSYVFFVIGDWGRKGKYHQKAVAETMNNTAKITSPEFIISTGDNFYTFGVKSTRDKLWKKSFEDIYNGDAIKNTTWCPVLGNHDHYGNEQAQVEYSAISKKWKMPAPYYNYTLTTDDGNKMLFVFTDTEPLATESEDKTKAQWQWIDSILTSAQTDWKIVVGHHPVYSSNPMHGDTKVLQDKLKPILEKSGTQVYFCGHDHDLQHQQPQGSKVDYFVSGAGSELRPTAAYQHTKFAKSAAGFALVAITKDVFKLLFIDESGNVIYQYSRGK